MRETANVATPSILSCFEMFREQDSTFYELFQPILERRLKFPQLRPIVTRLSYEMAGGKNWQQIVPICAAMELQTMYLYLHNWIFDNKKSLWLGQLRDIRTKVNNVIIAAAIMRELMAQTIGNAKISHETKEVVEKEFSESISEICYGQYLDINLTINRFDEFKSDEEFLKFYEYKSKILSGNAYRLSGRIGAILAGAGNDKISIISTISELLGVGIHVSNDLGDFAPPNQQNVAFGKPYQDQLADIRENRLTLPIYYVLKYGNPVEKENLLELVGNYEPTDEQILNACQAVHTSGAYIYHRKFMRRFFKDAKNILHEHFEKSEKRDIYSLMLSVIRTNKFLVELRNVVHR